MAIETKRVCGPLCRRGGEEVYSRGGRRSLQMRSHDTSRVRSNAGPNPLIGALLAVWLATVGAGLQSAEPQADTYVSASIDAGGGLVVTTSDRREIVVSKAAGQRA